MRRYVRRRRRRNRLRLLPALVVIIAGIALLWAAAQEDQPGEALPENSTVLQETEEFSLPLEVPFIDQRERWPTGCESVSATMVLQFFGAEITVDEFIEIYLPMADEPYYDASGTLVGADPCRFFLGDPRSERGWGCYAPAIVQALNAVRMDGLLGDPRNFAVTYQEDVPLEELCETYVKKGLPVLVWATIGMVEPFADAQMYVPDTGEFFQWYYPMHCLVLVGEDEENFYFNDPSAGKAVAYGRVQTETAYKALGKQAVVIRQRD